MKTGDIMTTKIVSISPGASILPAMGLMLQHRISGLPMLKEGDKRFVD